MSEEKNVDIETTENNDTEVQEVENQEDNTDNQGETQENQDDIESKNKQLYARATKAETELKELKSKQKSGETTNQEDDRVAQLERRLSDAEFYNENPQYKSYRDLISKFGDNPAEVIQRDDFKGVFSKISKAEELEKSQSVLKTNPRIGKANDKMKEAREAVGSGRTQQAEDLAVKAVLDAYED